MTATGPTLRSTVRGARGPLLVGAALVAAGVAVGVLTATGPAGVLEPDSYAPSGARAVTELLRDQGVQVDRAGTLDEVQALAGAGTTVLVASPDGLATSELASLTALDARLVVLAPDQAAVDALGMSAEVADGVPVEPRQPACPLPVAQRAGEALLGGRTFQADDSPGSTGCYASGGRATLLDVPAERAVLVGDGTFLTNDALGDTGNAALALGLLGGGDEVVFLLPQPGRVVPDGDAPPLSDLVPDGLKLAVLQGFVVLIVLALWRARRLGRVVEEPLPVVVRAAEAIEGRSRLYRAAGARGQAAEQLRAGTRDRVVRRLGLGLDARREATTGAAAEAVVSALAQRTGRDPVELGALLYGAAPADDPALVRLADDLRSLESTLTDSLQTRTQTREVAGS